MPTTTFQSSARAETTKRLIAQLVNERLVTLSLLDGIDKPLSRIRGPDDASRWLFVPVVDGLSLPKHLRPNDFQLPATLCSVDREFKEDGPGSIFAFIRPWFQCDEKVKASIVDELRNSALMLEQWMEIRSGWPILDINSSFLDWETQKNTSKARYITCTLRENLEFRANQYNEALVLASALIERPRNGCRSYAEIRCDLKTTNDKVVWFRRYIRSPPTLSLGPLARHGVGFEFHAQNAVVRICRRTKAIKGFAIRDLAGVKLHGPTLEAQGFHLTNLEAAVTPDVHQIWDRVHHALIQNHIRYLMCSLGLEDEHDGWRIVHSELERALDGDDESVQQRICRYFVKETMPFKSFMRMRMDASLKNSFKIVQQQVPNGLWKKSPWLRQVSLLVTKDAEVLVPPEKADANARIMENEVVQEAFRRHVAPYGQLPRDVRQLNAHPTVLPMKFLKNLERFREALALALDSIIDRWWTDEEADFPSRMPLEPRVDLLRWVAQGSDEGVVRSYKGNQGILRPDILIPTTGISGTPQFKVCEINGRFPISYLHYTASAYQALADTEWHNPSIKPATDHNKLFDNFHQDSPLFGLVEQRTGMRSRSVHPSSLRLLPSGTTSTGLELYVKVDGHENPVERLPDVMWLDGQVLEKVHQVGLQLYDFELFALAPEMIRQISVRSVNDVRSVFIAHDKRIPGVVHQELDALVHKHVITEAQSRILRDGIVPTIGE
ncbi:hypothetical protein AK830_g5103 [Neonectria ditissima]|uniref:Aerobactin siderophore biosynthesis IucA/IucC-like C-terminal domain-containing protein n=1 Tax=Neonectria ditissima TaxID=78410 RepID=A0A0P7B6C7_9HYPO|nr:hypothetical protein AK830_g5103 [Neonectria ditissima]